GGQPSSAVLAPAWEVRFVRSGKVDIPDGPRDTQNYLDPNGKPFIEPTLALALVRDAGDGRFAVTSVPRASGGSLWHIFVAQASDHKLAHYAIPSDDLDIFDLSGKRIQPDGTLAPDELLTLQAVVGADSAAFELQHAPTA